MSPTLTAQLVTLLIAGSALSGLRVPAAPGSLSDNQIISSEALGYDLQYRVYLPAGYDELSDLPVLFVTDGQWYIDRGNVPGVMDELIERGAIEPAIAVFVDNRDPHDLNVNRRNQ